MKGYLNNPEATADTVDDEGWLHTGDVAIVDDHGCYTVVDRVKELIKYKGYQVAPAELEAVLLGHPQIADAAVIGVPDKESGEELPKAFVVRAPGSELTEAGGHGATWPPRWRRTRRSGWSSSSTQVPKSGRRQDPAQGPQGPRLSKDARSFRAARQLATGPAAGPDEPYGLSSRAASGSGDRRQPTPSSSTPSAAARTVQPAGRDAGGIGAAAAMPARSAGRRSGCTTSPTMSTTHAMPPSAGTVAPTPACTATTGRRVGVHHDQRPVALLRRPGRACWLPAPLAWETQKVWAPGGPAGAPPGTNVPLPEPNRPQVGDDRVRATPAR